MILSILIPSTYDRQPMLDSLLSWMYSELDKLGMMDQVEILTDIDGGEIPTGKKRNDLRDRATGKYVVHFDSDDEGTSDYFPDILYALSLDPDVVGFDGWMTTNGQNRKNFRIRVGNPYLAVWVNGEEEYHRPPNHLSPIRKSIADQIPFPNVTFGEDHEYCMNLLYSGLIKTEVYIPKYLYHYKFISKPQ